MSKWEIRNCYDSHTHFLATGQVSDGLNLRDLKSPDDVQHISIQPQYMRSTWLTGFGWDQNLWQQQQLPTKTQLDQIFPDQPVFFSRVDGHSSWLNSKAIQELEKLGMDFSKNPVGGNIVRDPSGQPSGVLQDQAHIQALMRLPDFTDEQNKTFLKSSMKIFNRAGFTHVRDMSMTFSQWNLLCELQNQNAMTVCLEGFVTAESAGDLERAYAEVQKCWINPNPFLRMKGLKIFIDGSLGSKTAYLSKPYVGTTQSGLLSWTSVEIEQAIAFAWIKKCEIAIHVIGDQAAHLAAEAARRVSASGLLGRLHLEHVQLLRPETIQILKPLHVHCHMQPCHWLSDHNWLNQSIGDLKSYLFPWESLRKNKIPVFFGSDSPIEPTSLLRNWRALNESELSKIPKLNDDWMKYHAHPDSSWTNSHTVFDQERIHQVYFQGEPLL